MNRNEIAAAQLRAATTKEEFDKLMHYHFQKDMAKGEAFLKEYNIKFVQEKKKEPLKQTTNFVENKSKEQKKQEQPKINIEALTKMVIDEDRPIVEEDNK